MKQSVFGSWNITVIKSEQHLQIELCLETGDRVFTKTLTKIQKTLIAAKHLVNSSQTNFVHFLNTYFNKV